MVDTSSAIGSVVAMVQSLLQLLITGLTLARWLFRQHCQRKRVGIVASVFGEEGDISLRELLLRDEQAMHCTPDLGTAAPAPLVVPIDADVVVLDMDTAGTPEEDNGGQPVTVEQYEALAETDLVDTSQSPLFMKLRQTAVTKKR